MKKTALISVLVLLLATSFASAQNSLPATPTVHCDNAVIDYTLDANFFTLYDVSRYVVVTRLSDSHMEIMMLGNVLEGNTYPENTFGVAANFQPVGMSDIVPGLTPNTQYRIDLEVTGLDSATMSNINALWTDTITTPALSSINEPYAASTMSVFPNPVSEMLTVDGLHSGSSVTLTDLSGHIISQQQVQQELITVDVSLLTPGIYIVSCVYGDQKTAKRIVVQ